MLILDIQRETEDDNAPDDKRLHAVAESVLEAAGFDADAAEISLRIVGADEMQDLNARYRDRPYATNVLSFPASLPEGVDVPLLGDIAICAPVVRREAEEQGKALAAHWEHMLVHGVLHLLGHDHEEDREAEVMEDLERTILAGLGRSDPYTQGGGTLTAGAPG
jgi:probable rRNA maturation factor